MTAFHDHDSDNFCRNCRGRGFVGYPAETCLDCYGRDYAPRVQVWPRPAAARIGE